MNRTPPTRRQFVSASAGMFSAGWLWLHLPALAALSACAQEAARAEAPFRILSVPESAAMRAFAARLIPSDDALPGAEEAGAVWFVDGALDGPFAAMKEPVLAGLADLDTRSLATDGVTFAESTPERQDAIIGAIADTPFFGMARLLTVAGVFADPRYGGNRDDAGATILGIQHAAAYQPPFGWYDAQYEKGGGA